METCRRYFPGFLAKSCWVNEGIIQHLPRDIFYVLLRYQHHKKRAIWPPCTRNECERTSDLQACEVSVIVKALLDDDNICIADMGSTREAYIHNEHFASQDPFTMRV